VEVGRSEVDRDPALGPQEPGGFDGRLHPDGALPDGCLGQADEGEAIRAGLGGGGYVDGQGVDAQDRKGLAGRGSHFDSSRRVRNDH